MRQKSCYSERDKERQRVRDAACACRYFSYGGQEAAVIFTGDGERDTQSLPAV